MNKEDVQELTRLLELTWRKRSGEPDQSMVDHCLKSGKYIRIDDMMVDVCSIKPIITTTIWYDDETEGPEANFQNFKALNERQNMPSLYELQSHFCGVRDLYFIVQYSGDKTGGKLASLTYADEPSNFPLIRKVTPAELEQINAAVEEVRQDYAKRLVNYFKRYGKTHVSSRGYWVNR